MAFLTCLLRCRNWGGLPTRTRLRWSGWGTLPSGEPGPTASSGTFRRVRTDPTSRGRAPPHAPTPTPRPITSTWTVARKTPTGKLVVAGKKAKVIHFWRKEKKFYFVDKGHLSSHQFIITNASICFDLGLSPWKTFWNANANEMPICQCLWIMLALPSSIVLKPAQAGLICSRIQSDFFNFS